MKVYLVQAVNGGVYAIFHSREDAELHRSSIYEKSVVVERTVFTGQANNPGYNR